LHSPRESDSLVQPLIIHSGFGFLSSLVILGSFSGIGNLIQSLPALYALILSQMGEQMSFISSSCLQSLQGLGVINRLLRGLTLSSIVFPCGMCIAFIFPSIFQKYPKAQTNARLVLRQYIARPAS